MKNYITILTLLLSSLFYCQNDRTIDWQNLDKINGNITLLKPVSNRNFAVFKLTNINKFLYQVSITGKNVTIQTEMPDELIKLFRISKADLAIQADNEDAIQASEDANAAKIKMLEIKESTNIANLKKTITDELLPNLTIILML